MSSDILFNSIWDPATFVFPEQRTFGNIAKLQSALAYRAANSKGGTQCTCCGQHVQVYRRRIYKRMAKVLLWLVNEFERSGDWVVLKDGPLFRGGDNAKLAYWGLVQTRPKREVEHNKRNSGEWMPTGLGIKFARSKIRIPEHAFIYNGKVVGFSHAQVSISECLEGDFNLEDLDATGA
jgi:hypothetical protein